MVIFILSITVRCIGQHSVRMIDLMCSQTVFSLCSFQSNVPQCASVLHLSLQLTCNPLQYPRAGKVNKILEKCSDWLQQKFYFPLVPQKCFKKLYISRVRGPGYTKGQDEVFPLARDYPLCLARNECFLCHVKRFSINLASLVRKAFPAPGKRL